MEITVFANGQMLWNGRNIRCALGRGGVGRTKREGDGQTPAGRLPLRRVLYRPDRLAAPETALPVRALDERDGWCDDPNDPAYNTLIRLPHPAHHEKLWRDDSLYDLIVELGYNDAPVVPGSGSAIFLHLAKPDYAPTEGCVAVAREDLLLLLRACGPGDCLSVGED
ncbi:MAG: L,D-transpeptidase family protein [Rhodospirillales bacterium]|nr:L,D-transpeptidase family protein [Rhodospirillales bacterium]